MAVNECAKPNLRQCAKQNYNPRNDVAGVEELKIGALQNIADGLEFFGQRYEQLELELSTAKEDAKWWQDRTHRPVDRGTTERSCRAIQDN